MKMIGTKIISVLSKNKTLKDSVNEVLRYCINQLDSYYLMRSLIEPYPYQEMVVEFRTFISKGIRKQLLEKEDSS